MALKTIKGRYTNGVIEPDEPLGLVDGAEFDIVMDEQPQTAAAALHVILSRLADGGAASERTSEAESPATPSSEDAGEVLRSLAGAWKGHYEDPDELIRMIYESRITGSREPPDL